jgi:hypothetical protein
MEKPKVGLGLVWSGLSGVGGGGCVDVDIDHLSGLSFLTLWTGVAQNGSTV